MIKNPGVPYWRLSGYYFAFFMTVGVYLPYWPLYLESAGFDARQIGLLSAIVIGVKIFSSYFWGWVADHTGQRARVIRAASLCSALSFAMVFLARDFWSLALILFLFSLFWNASLPQVEADTMNHLGADSHVYTRIRLWGSMGFIVAVSGLGLVFEMISIHHIVPIFLATLVLMWLLTLTLEPAPPSGGASALSFKTTLRRTRVVALLISCFLMHASHAPYYIFYSIYLGNHGYSKVWIGQMWALGVVAEIVLFLFMHRLIAVFGLRRLILASLLLAVARWLMIAFFVDAPVLLGVAQLLHAATFGICHAVAIQYIHKYFRGALQGRGQGLYSSASFGAGTAFGGLAASYGWNIVGPRACFIFAAGCAFMALVTAWVFVDAPRAARLSGKKYD